RELCCHGASKARSVNLTENDPVIAEARAIWLTTLVFADASIALEPTRQHPWLNALMTPVRFDETIELPCTGYTEHFASVIGRLPTGCRAVIDNHAGHERGGVPDPRHSCREALER